MTDPYYDDGFCTIFHGDCRDLLPTLTNVDLFVTSPPYNLGTSQISGGQKPGRYTKGATGASFQLDPRALSEGYGTHDDAMPQDEYDAWQAAAVHAMWQVLSPSGAIFYNHKPRVQGGRLIMPTMYGDGLPLRQIITWDRGTGLNFNRSYFLPKSEWVVVWAKPEFRLNEGACEMGDVWRFPPERPSAHPAPFPLELPTRAIGSTSANLVVDPFMGSGTTLRAAKDLGRRAIGIEINERYCDLAATRLAQEVLDFGGAA